MKITILDLIARFQNESIRDSFDRSFALAGYADEKGFDRYWIAEHHNSKAVMGAATDILIGHVLEKTKRIRVGAGGVMLPNHTPFQVAERYGTLENLYPDRVDLGLGRAPGTDLETAKLIYRDIYREETFTQAIKDLLAYFDGEDRLVSPYPGTGTGVPIYILGSSTTSARVASQLGLPYSFAGHFSPHKIEEAFKIYREEFKPSKYLDAPYTMLAMSIYLAESKQEAEELNNHGKQIFLQLANRSNEEFYDLTPDFELGLTSIEKFMIRANRGLTLTGDKEAGRLILEEICQKYKPDELVATTYIPETSKLLKNYEILFDIVNL